MKSIFVIAFVFIHNLCFSSIISSNLTASYDPKGMAVKLKWQNNDARIKAFVLQKSSDNYKWTDLTSISAASFSESKMEKYLDEHPDPNRNYYRLRMVIDANNEELSAPIMVMPGQSASSWVMFPVPVTSILNLQYTGSDPIKGVITVLIQNSNGRVLKRFRSSSLTRTIEIPVSNMGKGIYDVKIMVGTDYVWNQRFIK